MSTGIRPAILASELTANRKMAHYIIPDQLLTTIRWLVDVPTGDLAEFMDELDQSVQPSLSVEAGLTRFLRNKETVPFDNAQIDSAQIGNTLLSLHYFRAQYPSAADLIRDILIAWTSGSDENDDERRALLEANLSAVLGAQTLEASTRAALLVTEHQRVFLSGDFLTDIRPVFTDEISSPLLGFVVMHNLKLSTKSEGCNEDIYIALDAEDLEQLRVSIDRALAKDRMLTERIPTGDGFLGQSLLWTEEG